MDYGKLLNRAWELIWENKFLIILGVLVALSSGLGSSTSSSINFRIGAGADNQGLGAPMPGAVSEPTIPIWFALFLVGLGLIVAFVLWVVSTLARGGLIAGAAAADGGQTTSFSQAWSAGWSRGWTLLGIGIVPAIPGLLLLLLAGVGLLAYNAGKGLGVPAVRNVAVLLAMLACIAVPLALVLELVRTFANRACMLEGLGVLESYRRGIQVLADNPGSALALFVIQIAVMIAMFILLIVPGIILALCCLFWPVLVFLQGAVMAYFSTMWTLAWQEWTGRPLTSL